jgi:hypothetical protein
MLRQLASAGARGIGELRPSSSGYNLANSDEADLLLWAAAAYDLALLFTSASPSVTPTLARRACRSTSSMRSRRTRRA